MFFWKTAEGGGGSFPIQKITLQILLVSKRYILGKKAQCNFQKGGRGGRKLEYRHSFIAIYPLLCGKGLPSGERIFPPGERILSTTFATTVATTVATNDCVCGESTTNMGHEF